MQDQTGVGSSHSPSALLAASAKGRIVMWLLVSAAMHAIFVTLLSVGYIRDRWIDPAGAVQRKAAAEAATKNLQKAATAAKAGTAAEKPVPQKTALEKPATEAGKPAVAPAESGATTAKTAAVAARDKEQIPPERQQTPEARAITEAAKPGELPKEPETPSMPLP